MIPIEHHLIFKFLLEGEKLNQFDSIKGLTNYPRHQYRKRHFTIAHSSNSTHPMSPKPSPPDLFPPILIIPCIFIYINYLFFHRCKFMPKSQRSVNQVHPYIYFRLLDLYTLGIQNAWMLKHHSYHADTQDDHLWCFFPFLFGVGG